MLELLELVDSVCLQLEPPQIVVVTFVKMVVEETVAQEVVIGVVVDPEGQSVQVPHGFVLLPLRLEEVTVHE
jgi:hypothetical protein